MLKLFYRSIKQYFSLFQSALSFLSIPTFIPLFQKISNIQEGIDWIIPELFNSGLRSREPNIIK